MRRVFLGYDPREALGYHVCLQSILERSGAGVTFVPLTGAQRDGTNAFTYARFMVPELCAWSGVALFIDGSDMLLRAPLEELFALYDKRYAVQVVKHDYRTKHPRKYVGTPMEADNLDYPRKNWSSVMLFNCSAMEHFKHRRELREGKGAYLHRFSWLPDGRIGALPPEWNVLVGEQDEEQCEAKLAHFTLGIPAMKSYASCRYAGEWFETLQRLSRAG